MWCIPPKQDAAFVCAMEDVLAVYQRPYDARYPVVCMDETSKQCVKEVREVVPPKPGQTERYDVEYERNGVAHLFMFCEPLAGKRRLRVADNHGALEWAEGIRVLLEEHYPQAQRITLVMDNLNTHTGASLYKAFPPEQARRLLDKLEFATRPNMAAGSMWRKSNSACSRDSAWIVEFPTSIPYAAKPMLGLNDAMKRAARASTGNSLPTMRVSN